MPSTQTYRPQNLNIWVKFDLESEFEVENAQFLRLEPKIDPNLQQKERKNNYCPNISLKRALQGGQHSIASQSLGACTPQENHKTRAVESPPDHRIVRCQAYPFQGLYKALEGPLHGLYKARQGHSMGFNPMKLSYRQDKFQKTMESALFLVYLSYLLRSRWWI